MAVDERSKNGSKSFVLEDEPECEGLINDSVVSILKKKGYNADDEHFRNMHLLSSTTFDPQAYMAHVHRDTPMELLRAGLDNLERSMAQKSGSLKALVESNFERFVRAKTTLDDVHMAMRNQGIEQNPERPQRHSRHASRTSTHFRNPSGQSLSGLRSATKVQTNEKRKLALVKESEYGVQGIKIPLTEAAAKAEEVYNPALNSRDRVKLLRDLGDSLDECKGIVDLMDGMSQAVEHKDYDGVVECYEKSVEARKVCQGYAKEVERNGTPLTDAQVRRCVITAKTVLNINHQLEGFKRDVWRDLTSVQANMSMSTDRSRQNDHMALIKVLLSLGVEDNPIWVWLISRYDYLKNKISATFERSRVEIEVFRRRLANADRPSLQATATHFKSPSKSNPEDRMRYLDTAPILELWDVILSSLNNLVSIQGGVLGEVLDFWDKAQSFITGQAQISLPVGHDGSSREHHLLSTDDIKMLQDGAAELIEMLRDQIMSFFMDPPVEDVSLLFSPVPDTPMSPMPGSLSPFARPDHRFGFDSNTPPPPSPKKGEAWEKYAFWPPYANVLSGVHYMGKLLEVIGTAAAHMSSVGSAVTRGQQPERMRHLVNQVREAAARAVCEAWDHDAEASKILEDWTRDASGAAGGLPDTTHWPARFQVLESTVLQGMQKVLYISEATGVKGGSTAEIVAPPPQTLLNGIRKSFTSTIYKGLSGMVENVAQTSAPVDNPWLAGGRASLDQSFHTLSIRDAFDPSLKGPRMLLTLSNLGALNRAVIPALVSEFETAFSMTLSDDVSRLNDMLTKFDDRMFRYYVSPVSSEVRDIILDGLSRPTWPPASPQQTPAQVGAYVYPALLRLVAAHAEVSATAPGRTPQIVRKLLEDASRAFLDGLRRRCGDGKHKFPLAVLMQATLDLEFFAQTLSQYASEASQAAQTEIYALLDAQGEPGSRDRLQGALRDIKASLKALREGSKAQFACFRRHKDRGERERGERERGERERGERDRGERERERER